MTSGSRLYAGFGAIIYLTNSPANYLAKGQQRHKVNRSPAIPLASGRLKEPITLSPKRQEAFMAFAGIYTPQELALLRKVVDDASAGIERSGLDYLDASYLVLSLFGKGAQTAEELKSALDAALAGDERPSRQAAR
jgi:hypothetical protein